MPTPVLGHLVMGAVSQAPILWRENAFLPDTLDHAYVFDGSAAQLAEIIANAVTDQPDSYADFIYDETDGSGTDVAGAAASTSDNGMPVWASVTVGLIAVLIVLVIVVVFLTHRKHHPGDSTNGASGGGRKVTTLLTNAPNGVGNLDAAGYQLPVRCARLAPNRCARGDVTGFHTLLPSF